MIPLQGCLVTPLTYSSNPGSTAYLTGVSTGHARTDPLFGLLMCEFGVGALLEVRAIDQQSLQLKPPRWQLVCNYRQQTECGLCSMLDKGL